MDEGREFPQGKYYWRGFHFTVESTFLNLSYQVVNKDMSTFILALLEILQDIKYFLVVLVVVIFMFGDM